MGSANLGDVAWTRGDGLGHTDVKMKTPSGNRSLLERREEVCEEISRYLGVEKGTGLLQVVGVLILAIAKTSLRGLLLHVDELETRPETRFSPFRVSMWMVAIGAGMLRAHVDCRRYCRGIGRRNDVRHCETLKMQRRTVLIRCTHRCQSGRVALQ